MFLPIRTDSPLRSTPWMNWLLIAVNVGVFALQKYGGGSEAPYLLHGGNPHLQQFITYAFLHAGAWHLIGNMLFLYIFGNNVCDRFGNLGYLGLYLGGGVFAGVCYTLVSNSPMLGASGAVSAVTGAYIVLLPRSYITIFYWFIFIGVVDIPSLYFIIFYFCKDLIFAYMGASNVAHEAHVAGSVFGFFLSLLLQAGKLLPRDQFDMMSLLDRWKRRRDYTAMVGSGYGPIRSPRQPPPLPQVPPAPAPVMELRAQLSEAMAHRRIGDAAVFFVKLREMDRSQTLPRPTLQQIGSYLYSKREYAPAADAFEMYLVQPGSANDSDQVNLMLGLMYARYLQRLDRARQCLREAARLARSERDRTLAESELNRIGPS